MSRLSLLPPSAGKFKTTFVAAWHDIDILLIMGTVSNITNHFQLENLIS